MLEEQYPQSGGSWIRDTETGALSPNLSDPQIADFPQNNSADLVQTPAPEASPTL